MGGRLVQLEATTVFPSTQVRLRGLGFSSKDTRPEIRLGQIKRSHARKSALDLSERKKREEEVTFVASKLIDLMSYRFSLPRPRSTSHSHTPSFPIKPFRRDVRQWWQNEENPPNERRGTKGKRSDLLRRVNEEVKLREATTKIRRAKAYDHVDVLLNEELGRRGDDRQL